MSLTIEEVKAELKEMSDDAVRFARIGGSASPFEWVASHAYLTAVDRIERLEARTHAETRSTGSVGADNRKEADRE